MYSGNIISCVRLLAAAVAVLSLVLCGCPQPQKQHKAAKTPEPAPETAEKVILALDPDGQQVRVRPMDDPGNPWKGKYSDLDRWCFENYDRGEENPMNWASWLNPGIGQRALLVDDDGYAVPGLEYLRFELEQRRLGNPPNQRPAENIMYAIGPLSDELNSASLEDRFKLIAEYMPPIPEWLALEPPCWALFLPDGTVVTRGPLASGAGYFPKQGEVRGLREMAAYHYSSEGDLLKQGEDGELWCELFFPMFEETLELHGIGRESVRESGCYITFQNLGERDRIGHYLYDGTPLEPKAAVTKPDFNSLFEMYGRYIPAMYARQQAAPAGGVSADE